jgi:hypothetical protein
LSVLLIVIALSGLDLLAYLRMRFFRPATKRAEVEERTQRLFIESIVGRERARPAEGMHVLFRQKLPHVPKASGLAAGGPTSPSA